MTNWDDNNKCDKKTGEWENEQMNGYVDLNYYYERKRETWMDMGMQPILSVVVDVHIDDFQNDLFCKELQFYHFEIGSIELWWHLHLLCSVEYSSAATEFEIFKRRKKILNNLLFLPPVGGECVRHKHGGEIATQQSDTDSGNMFHRELTKHNYISCFCGYNSAMPNATHNF